MSISQTAEGHWVIDGDTHIGKWVKESKRLDHDQNSLPILFHCIHKGDYVMDVGANIGDHTVAYADWVGSTGHVLACECNSEAIECLRRNTANYNNVEIFPNALYSDERNLYFTETENVGASFVTTAVQGHPVKAYTIDQMRLDRLDYLKIDAEGCETEILRGAAGTIRKFKPIIVLEINPVCLERSGSSEEELLIFLGGMGYEWKTLFPDSVLSDGEQYDIIAKHK